MSIVPPSTTPAFQFTIKGHTCEVDGLLYLVCADDTHLRVVPPPREFPTVSMLWHVIPSTDSTGLISSVRVVDAQMLEATLQHHQDKCQLVGRVVDLGKRQKQVLFKVTRPGEKTLKLTLLSPDPHMKVGQLWSCTAVLVGCTLQITHATPLEGISNRPTPAIAARTEQQKNFNTAQISERIVLPDPARWEDIALAALCCETGVTSWELQTARQRKYGWEWEALVPTTGQRARVQVDSQSKRPQVYQYPVVSQSPSCTQSNDTDRLIVTPLGAAKGIGASCFRVEIGPYEVVLDCGIRPKGHDPLPALGYLKNPDLLLISHAHQDHLGAVPVFHSRWPGVRMICTPGTREIAHVMLQDCLKVQQRSEDSPELFDEVELDRTLFRLETKPTGQDFEPLPGLKVRFINAGHILGAACIYLRYGETSLLYTGDYNTTSSRTTEGLRLADLPQADMLITESTYGADTHPSRKAQETALLNAIREVVQAGGNVLIPAFALGRAQEILLAMRTSKEFQLLQIPIYVDGLVRAVTDTFRDNLELLPSAVQNLVKHSETEPFFDEKSNPPIIPIASPKERPLAIARTSVIVASSGMLTGGASVYYAKILLERENAAIFVSGYQDEDSPGRLLQNLQTGDKIELDSQKLTVRARIERFNLSAHADKVGLTQVISKVNPKHLVLIHGSSDALHKLARSGDLRSKHYIHIPSVGDKIELGVVPEHLNSKQVARIELPQEFEVEVEAEVEGAWLRIPAKVVESDPRWHILAGSGVLKARWDGINLKLCPVDSQQLAIQQAIASGADCCAKCQHFDHEKSQCQRPSSPLYGRGVDPAGYCLEYAAIGVGVTQDETLA